MSFLAEWADELSALGATLAVAALIVASGGTLAAVLIIGASLASAGALAGHAYDMLAQGLTSIS
ncbi:hypothetical protein NKH77_23360 [Streptomyces sp. M19]